MYTEFVFGISNMARVEMRQGKMRNMPTMVLSMRCRKGRLNSSSAGCAMDAFIDFISRDFQFLWLLRDWARLLAELKKARMPEFFFLFDAPRRGVARLFLAFDLRLGIWVFLGAIFGAC